jgi:Zn-dependent protease with chaperone function
VGVFTVMILGGGYKMRQLSGGGTAVAELLGGRLLDLNTDDPDERRLLNVVEEMAIAAGLPVPDVYVLEEEHGINAFAAGNNISEAAIGVTFGALKLLSRDELQGVVAHEFSHILNGDMRLNTRLIGWFHGILGLIILGRILTVGHHIRGGRSLPFFYPWFIPGFVLGAICFVAGSIGGFFARIVKSAVSRQREYLADAAAVQFTRNPDGIAGALKKIGGLRFRSVLYSARAEEASHMYFSDGLKKRWLRFTSTHPLLTERIRMIDPQFDGRYKPVSIERVLRESKGTAAYREHAAFRGMDFEQIARIIGPVAAAREMLHANAARETSSPVDPVTNAAQPIIGSAMVRPVLAPAVSAAHLDYAAALIHSLPESLRQSLRESLGAVAVVYAMLCSRDPERRAAQLSALAGSSEHAGLAEVERLLPEIDRMEAGALLPMADLAVRVLRQLSPEQYEVFRANLRLLVEADEQIDLFEYMLERMVVRHLDPHFRTVRRTPVQYYTLRPLIPSCAVLLSGLARIGSDSDEEAAAAFYCGAAKLGADFRMELLDLEHCNLPQMDAAIEQTAQASLQVKKVIFEALIWAAATDGRLSRREAELLRAIGDAFDMALPPFLCGDEPRMEQ